MEEPSNDAPGSDPMITDVSPLRTLAPMFPAAYGSYTFTLPGAHSFTPYGSFASGSETGYPPGFYPMYPNFSASQPSNQRPSGPIPMATGNGAAHAGEGSNTNGKLSIPEIQTPPLVVSPLNIKGPLPFTPISASGRKIKHPLHLDSYVIGSSCTGGTRQNKGRKRMRRPTKAYEDVLALPSSSHNARESVEAVLMTFDAIRRRLWQMDEVSDLGLKRRPDIKAGTVIKDNDLRANTIKSIGRVPGVEVGDLFFFRSEMCVVGLHTQNIGGIDFMAVKFDNEDDSVALSVVSAGGYENREDEVDFLLYCVQGGGGDNKREKKQVDDQKLERGHFSLGRSLHRGNVIRVIRNERCFSCHHGKVYIYDGLYKICNSWIEKGKEGYSHFMYKLVREPGQPDGIAVWKRTEKWKKNPSTRGNVILPDISSGMENLPICLVNDVDDEKGPSHFTYATQVNYLSPLSSKVSLQGCLCNNVCLPGNTSCFCAQNNGGEYPYSLDEVLVRRKSMIYECSTLCQCSIDCRNRVTQKGIGLYFEVFRTRDRGWGLRSWDAIRAGTFICEFIGELIDKTKVEEDIEEDEFIFNAPHADDTTLKWNYGPELMGKPFFMESNESSKPLNFAISGKKMGNISRFINHSCSPNAFWQPVLHGNSYDEIPHIMFFAMKSIPPMTEITYDYGASGTEIGIDDASREASSGREKCLCGAPKCRGFFG